MKSLCEFFPIEIIYHIRSYMKNEAAEQALKEYFQYLRHKRELYRDFAYEQYVAPHCECHRMRRGRECRECYLYEYTNHYEPNDFIVCIRNNAQCHKIMYGNYSAYQDLYDDDHY
jgi:hypothetical protein